MIGTEGNNFLPNSFLTYRQVTSLYQIFRKNPSKDMKLFKTQLSKIMQSCRFLGRPLGPLLKFGLSLV